MAKNISLRQLIVFREILKLGSISGASKTLFRTQPSISVMLASMENELGFTLFERRGNRLIPKPEAYYFQDKAEQIINQFQNATSMMDEVGKLQSGQLRIACMPSLSLFIIPHLISEFIRDKPQVNISLLSNNTPVVHEWISTQQFDIGVAEVEENKPSLNSEVIYSSCLCAISAKDPLAKKKIITPQDLSGKAMVALFPSHFTSKVIKNVFEQNNASFYQRFEVRAFIPALEFVEQGLAYCICDPISMASYNLYRQSAKRLVFRKFTPTIDYSFAILRPAYKPASLIGRAFYDFLLNRLTKILPSKN